MSKAKKGDTVNVHYKGTLIDGSVFDTSEGREPLKFVIGQNQLIPAFEEAVSGLSVGESITVNIAAVDAYGPRRDDLILKVEKKQFPPEISPEVGQQLQIPQQNGQTVLVIVTDITETDVTLDANHPLAGQDLTFNIELVSIEPQS